MEARVPFIFDYLKKFQQRSLRPDAWREIGKWRNWSFDAMFYDIGCVPPELWSQLTSHKTPEGSIVLLKRVPGMAGTEARTFQLLHYGKIDDVKMEGITALAIAGVGSSALGTVALAIDVADALGGEVTVAGIVTGEGRKDVAEEGMGGWYVLREANLIRQAMENWLDTTKIWLDRAMGIPARLVDQLFNVHITDTDLKLPESTDIIRFLENAKDLKLVVAHSKGGFYLANALSLLADEARKSDGGKKRLEALLDGKSIVTLGAVIYPPTEFYRCMHQFIGELDAFGMMNSRERVERTVIPGVMHHLNTALPMHMSCNKVLRSHFPELISLVA
ncbi:MAG: hypothetical protein H6R10_2737 [Rhodocyclaceae bacterium]|nr:hypothetical protein [Rhodocyclaceae bacterium]